MTVKLLFFLFSLYYFSQVSHGTVGSLGIPRVLASRFLALAIGFALESHPDSSFPEDISKKYPSTVLHSCILWLKNYSSVFHSGAVLARSAWEAQKSWEVLHEWDPPLLPGPGPFPIPDPQPDPSPTVKQTDFLHVWENIAEKYRRKFLENPQFYYREKSAIGVQKVKLFYGTEKTENSRPFFPYWETRIPSPSAETAKYQILTSIVQHCTEIITIVKKKKKKKII
jgi:hypothetical protein